MSLEILRALIKSSAFRRKNEKNFNPDSFCNSSISTYRQFCEKKHHKTYSDKETHYRCKALSSNKVRNTIDKWTRKSDYPNRNACDAAAAFGTLGAVLAEAGLVATAAGAIGGVGGAVAGGIETVIGKIEMKELLSYSSCSCARNYPPAKAKGHGGVTIKLLHNYKHKLDFFVEKAGCAGLEYSGPTPFATVCYTKKHVKKGHIVNYRPSNILGAGRVEVFFAH